MATCLSKDSQPEDGPGMTINCYANSIGYHQLSVPLSARGQWWKKLRVGVLKQIVSFKPFPESPAPHFQILLF